MTRFMVLQVFFRENYRKSYILNYMINYKRYCEILVNNYKAGFIYFRRASQTRGRERAVY